MEKNNIIQAFKGGIPVYISQVDFSDTLNLYALSAPSDDYVAELQITHSGQIRISFLDPFRMDKRFAGPLRTVDVHRKAEILVTRALERQSYNFGLLEEVDKHFIGLGARGARRMRETLERERISRLEADNKRLMAENEVLKAEIEELKSIIELM